MLTQEEERALRAELSDLQTFRADVMAGCDIGKGDRLYRQVEVVIGPGLTRDQLEVRRLRKEGACVS